MIRTYWTYSQWRWLFKALQAVFIIGIPFIIVNDNSLLRFDVPTLRLYIFGKPFWMDEFFIVLLGSLFLAFLFILITLLYGRIWCGWACPQTVLNDISDIFFGNDRRRPLLRSLFGYIAAATISLIVGANLVWYFVTPYEFFERLFMGNLGEVVTGFWLVLSALMFLNLMLVKRRFCASVCPYAKLQSIMYDRHTMVISFDQGRQQECMNCKACLRACPVAVDLREGLSPACINCAECIDVCKKMTAKTGRETLIDYRFGLSNETMKPLRPQAIIIALLTLISLLAFMYGAAMRSSFDVVVTQNQAFAPRVKEDGSFVNSYILTISNRTEGEISLKFKAEGGSTGKLLWSSPETLSVPAKTHQRLPVYVALSRNLTDNYIDIVINSSDGIVYKKTVGFIKPKEVN